jgi:RNA polymerase primary sigma factor
MCAMVRRRRTGTRDSLSTYLNDIGAIALLSRQDEAELARRARGGDHDALDQLVCANLRFVVTIAKRYQTRGVLLADLISEGNFGLIEAAGKFDETKGVRFISYAVWWVRQMILQAVAEQGHAVRVPVSRATALFRLNRRAEAIRQQLGREPTRAELAAAGDAPLDALDAAVPLARPPVSLDAAVAGREESSLLDFLQIDDASGSDQRVNDAALNVAVVEALSRLQEREAHVLRLYFGFDGQEAMTLDAIGASMGVTRERARQIKERGLRKLRHSVYGRTLAALRE